MKRAILRLVVAVALALAPGAWAAEIYVSPDGSGAGSRSSPAGLQAALDTARTNGEADTLFLRAGTYDASATGADTYVFDGVSVGADGKAVTLSGGWDAAFAAQADDPAATALDGGGTSRVLHISSFAPPYAFTVENLAIRNGKTTAGANGAGIYAEMMQEGSLTLTVRDCVFHGSLAEDGEGGAIAASCPLSVEGCEFTQNRASSGGAVRLFQFATPTVIEDSRFSDNSTWEPANPAGYRGSAIASYGAELTISGCEFRGMSGGGSTGYGSPVYVETGHLTARNSSFRDIVVDLSGSAIGLYESGAEIAGCLFEGNRAGGSPGNDGFGAVTFRNASPTVKSVTIVNCTFAGNRSSSDFAGDAEFWGGSVTIANSIFSDNTDKSVACWVIACTGGVDYSSVEGGSASVYGLGYGTHNSTADPLFVAGDQDFHLQAASPCIDAGDNAAVPAALETDFEQDPRKFAVGDLDDLDVDIGWDEHYDGVLDLTTPTAGAFWLNDGSTRTVAWNCQNIGGDVRLYVWQGDRWTGHEATEIAARVPCSAQTHEWVPPAHLEAADYAVVVDSWRYETVGDDVKPVRIGHLNVTAPNGGQAFTQGSTYPITWQSGNLPGATIAIQLYSGLSPALPIAAAAPDTGTFLWKVPYTLLPGAAYRVRISTTNPIIAEDWSDAPFRILPALTLTAPNGGQVIKRGTTYRITWAYKNKPGVFVALDLYRGGVRNRAIAPKVPVGVAGKGSYLWLVPATQALAKTYTVRVRSTTNANCFDFSNKPFTIAK